MPTRPVILANGTALAPIGTADESEYRIGESVALTLQSTAGYSSFAWSVVGKPAGSAVALGSSSGYTSSIAADVAGEYVIKGTATGADGTSSARVSLIVVRSPARGVRKPIAVRSRDLASDVDDLKTRLAEAIDEYDQSERVINPAAEPYCIVADSASAATANTTALNAALADAKSTGRPVLVPAGNYYINGSGLALTNAYGLRFLGAGRGVTVLTFTGTYYDAQAAIGFSISAGTNQLTMPAGFLEQGATDAGKRLFVYGAGTSGERLVCTVVSVSGTTVTISTNAITTVSNVVARIVPPAAIELFGMEQCIVGNFTIAGSGSSGSYQMWAGLRVGSAPLGGTQVSQRNRFDNLHIGSTQVGIEVYGPRDGNNDLSSIVQPYIANYDLCGIALLDSQQFDWKIHGPTCYGDSGWTTPKTCSIASGTTTLTTDVPRFGRRHKHQWIEIVGAGPGGSALFTQITAVASSTQVTVAHAASTTVSSAAALRMGAQSGIQLGPLDGLTQGGNCTATDLLFTSHMHADVWDGSFNGGAVEISGGSSEASRALYVQPINGGTQRKATIRGYRFAHGAVINERPVIAVTAGPFAAERVDFGQAGGGSPAALRLQVEPQTPTQFIAALRDCNVSSSLGREDVFSKFSQTGGALRSYKPTSADNVVLHGTGGTVERIDRYQRNEDGRPESWLRLEGGREQGPDFSGLGTMLLDYDPLANGGASLVRVVGIGGSSTYRGLDRSGNARHAERTGAVSVSPSLQAAGKYGRLGWRFYGGSALFMPAAAFSGLTAIEVWAVVQIMTVGGGLHALGASAAAGPSCHTPYSDNVVYDDTLSGTRSSSAAQATIINEIRCVQAYSDASQHVVVLDGATIISAGAHAVVTPTSPVLGAGAANGTTPSAPIDAVVLRYVVFSAIATADQRAAGRLACQQFYGAP